MTRAEANAYRSKIEQAASNMDDTDALNAVELFPAFEKLVEANTKVAAGFRFRFGGELYRTEQAEYTFDGVYKPESGTESLFSKVAMPTTGTTDNPIPYSGNMALENGKYYEQDGVVYRCFRDTGTPVYNTLADLINIYVVLADA